MNTNSDSAPKKMAPAATSAYNDSRFFTISDKAREIKGLARELNEMSHHKFGELLGDNRAPQGDLKSSEPTCWADRVILEQDLAIDVIRDTLERISII